MATEKVGILMLISAVSFDNVWDHLTSFGFSTSLLPYK